MAAATDETVIPTIPEKFMKYIPAGDAFTIYTNILGGRYVNKRMTIKQSLEVLKNLMLLINGQKIGETLIRPVVHEHKCFLFGNEPHSNYGCKTMKHYDDKKAIMKFLKDAIVYIFATKTPDILADTDPYIDDLKTTIEFYSHFISTKELTPIYTNFLKELVDELNGIFGRDIIINRCTDADGYGCGRMVYLRERSPKVERDKNRILLLSSSGYGGLASGSNINVSGGRRKTRKRKQKSEKRRRHR